MSRPACPIAGCVNTRNAAHMMCPSHWKRVPKALQATVTRIWDAYQGARDSEIKLQLYRDYLTARSAAIATVGRERAP